LKRPESGRVRACAAMLQRINGDAIASPARAIRKSSASCAARCTVRSRYAGTAAIGRFAGPYPFFDAGGKLVL
jgi:hypothetical protein